MAAFIKGIRMLNKRETTGQRGQQRSIYLYYRHKENVKWWKALTGENLSELIDQALAEFFKSKGK